MKRVKKSVPYVCAISSGANRKEELKSRVWSRAMMTSTSPRKISTDTKRDVWAGRRDFFVPTLAAIGEVAGVTMPQFSGPNQIISSSFHRNEKILAVSLWNVKKL
jgi:hypothetical protein